MKKPKVSIIIPNYSHAQYLKQRIDSVIYQTYDEFELIILDDASPDNGASKTVIEHYRGNPHISHIVYNEVNSGSTFIQWQRGIQLACGEYIWIAESDDYCEPTFLQELVTVLNENKRLAFAYSPVVKVDENGNVLSKEKEGPSIIFNGFDFIRRFLLTYNSILNVSCALIRRAALDKIEGLYKTYKTAADYMFFVELSGVGDVAVVNKNLCYWRRCLNSVTDIAESNGSNFLNDKKIISHIFQKINNLSQFYYKVACDARFIRAEYVSFDTPEIKNNVYALWGYNNILRDFGKLTEVERIYNISRMRIRLVYFDVKYKNQALIPFIISDLYKVRDASIFLYLKILFLLFIYCGPKIALNNYNYVCLMKAVHPNLFMRVIASIRVIVGKIRRKIYYVK